MDTNLGKMMEKYGRHSLGESYINPMESFPSFQKFSVDFPEVFSQRFTAWNPLCESLLILS